MAKKSDKGLVATFLACSGLAAGLAVYNWGYVHEREFDASVIDYVGETTCRRAQQPIECSTSLTHVIVSDPYRNRIAVELVRPDNLSTAFEFPHQIGDEVSITYKGVPNDPVRFHQEKLSTIENATIEVLER